MNTAVAAAAELAAALGLSFKNPALLRQALTHRSHTTAHNERLEFLGDAILDCVIADLLFHRHPEAKEGDLSRLRASLVCQPNLAEIARSIGLGHYLFLGVGELKSGGKERPSILADALEAVIGAIYVDSGYSAAHAFILRLFASNLETQELAQTGRDAKTKLQEYLQARKLPLPTYDLVATFGEAHVQEFEVECVIAGCTQRWRGIASNRRAAEQIAANHALTDLHAHDGVPPNPIRTGLIAKARKMRSQPSI